MLAAALRRIVLAFLVLAAFSFCTFYFFASTLPPLKGRPPLHEYWRWLTGLADGRSFHSLTFVTPTGPLSVWTTVLPALGHTAALLAAAVLIVVACSLALAYVAARWRRSPVDLVLRGLSYLGWAIPAYLMALLVQLAVSSAGGIRGAGGLPLAGWPGFCPASIGLNAGVISPCPPAGSGLGYVVNVLEHITLPALALAAGFLGLHGRYLRSGLLDALDSNYVVTARAKGLSERRVILRHALRNSLTTFVSALLADVGVIFGAALAVDWVFQLNGLGALFLRQFPQGPGPIDTYTVEVILLITGTFVLLSSLASDLVLAWLDPRARHGG
ncbi:MAG: ABC transporter permease [Gaiellaceae bacterium]